MSDQWQAGSRMITWNEFDAIYFPKELTVEEARIICEILNAKGALPKQIRGSSNPIPDASGSYSGTGSAY